MNKSIFIIAGIIIFIIASSYMIIRFNPQLQSQKWINPIAEIYGLTAKKTIQESNNAVYCIFDPSGSGKSTFGVPVISTDFIQQIISTISDKGKGELWLTFIDRSALNNKVLHFTIPDQMKVFETPVRKSGQLKGEYDKELADFREDSVKNALQMANDLQSYIESKQKFLNECFEMINIAYAPKKSFEDYSDVIGSINAAIRSLATIESDSFHFKSILLISDGVQDVPASDTKQQLNEIPSDIMLVTVNYGGSLNNVVAGKSIEVDNLDRGLNKVIRVYKPKNQ